MRIYEIITEGVEPGWQEEPQRFDVPGGGIILIGTRYDEDGEKATVQFLYYDDASSNKPSFSIRVDNVSGNKKISEYIRDKKTRTIDGSTTTIEEIQDYFAKAVSERLYMKGIKI